MGHLYAVRDAPTLDAARAAADRLANTFRQQFPAAVACLEDDMEALLAIHRVPVRHRIRVRTDQPGGAVVCRGTAAHKGGRPVRR
jgi:transposase-like protein